MATAVECVADLSIRDRLLRAGYLLAPSPIYGCRRVLRDGVELGHFSSVDATRRLLGVFVAQGRYGAPRTPEQDAEYDRQDRAEEATFYASRPGFFPAFPVAVAA